MVHVLKRCLQRAHQLTVANAHRRMGVFVLVVALVILVASPMTHAQNLLTNASLEGLDGFSIPPGSCSRPGNWYWSYECIPEIEPPTWWYPFWNDGPSAVDPDTDYRRPEFRMYSWPDGPHYTCDGTRYLVYFGFFGAIDAGIYQQVNVSAGAKYEFSYQAFAWSNCLDGKVPGSGLGCDDFPPDQAVFKAGIDPAGGTDYASPGIVWSDGDSIYDAYDTVSVSTFAAANTITVFVRCTFWHNYIQHNDAHVDALQLIQLGPEIELNPTQFDHTIFIGDPAPGDDTFTVANSTGTGTLDYTIGDDAAWLGVAPTEGSSTGEADPVTVSYDVSGLRADNYAALITGGSDDASESPKTVVVHLTIQTVRPDLDGDSDVDQEDFGLFQVCYSGPGIPPTPGCESSDLERDDDVDLDDFGTFQVCVSGTDVPADPGCAAWAPDPPD